MPRKRLLRLVTVFFAGVVLLEGVITWQIREQIRDGQPDFTIFYTAGSILRQHAASDLYNLELQQAVQARFAPRLNRSQALPYNHPPFESILFAPLTYLSYPNAYLAWAVANLMLLSWIVIALRKHLAPMQGIPLAFWLLLALSFFPIFVALVQGQDSLLLLLLVALGYLALRAGRPLMAGFCLGLGLFRFHLVLPVILVLVLHRKAKVLAGFAAAALLAVFISVWLIGIHQTLAYPLWAWHLERAMGTNTPLIAAMPNLRGVLQIALRSETGKLSGVIAAAGGTLLLLWAAWRCNFNGSQRAFDLSFSLTLVTVVVTSYHVLPHDLSLLFLAILLVFCSESDIHWRWRDIALWSPVVMLCFGPGLMLLWFSGKRFSLLAPVLLLWVFGMAQAIRVGEPLGSLHVPPGV